MSVQVDMLEQPLPDHYDHSSNLQAEASGKQVVDESQLYPNSQFNTGG